MTYTLHFLHSQLERLTSRRLVQAADKLATHVSVTAPDALLPGENLIATIAAAPSSRLLRATKSIAALAALIDDVRVFLRLWGLLSIWSWAKSTWREPEKDKILKGVAWAQVGVNVLYQYLENGAYLASHGVLDFGEKKVANWYIWSSRFWMMHVILDLARLARVRVLTSGAKNRKSEKEDKMEASTNDARWWRELYSNAAYFPLTIHWSLEDGWLGESWVGACGMIAGFLSLKETWRTMA